MSATVLVCSRMFDGTSEELTGMTEISIEGNRITSIGRSVSRPPGAQVIDLSDRTVSPGFIDTHVHLTMDAAHLVQQTLESSASKALKGLSLAREYMSLLHDFARPRRRRSRMADHRSSQTRSTRDSWKDLVRL